MVNKPLISVIITNYNYGQFIGRAIKSILAQTYSNIELIIINDGSTDDSDEIIQNILSKNIDRNITYVNRENKGVVFSRNEGIELAKGEYICYLDADDYFNPSYISKSYNIALQSGADVVYPNWHFVGEWLGHPDTNFPEFSPELLQLQKLHCTPSSLIKKSAIKHHRFEVEEVGEDWDFFVGLSLDGARFKLAKDNPINYRIRKGTRGSKNDPKVDTQHFLEILTKYKEIYGDKVIDPNRLAKLRHPNVVMRVLTMRYPRVVIESIRRDGARVTTKKIVGKFASRNPWMWKTIGYARNRKYQKISRSQSIKTSPNAKLAIIIHLYYPDLWTVIRERLSHIKVNYDLFVSVQPRDKDMVLDKVGTFHGTTNIIALPNRGRDVLPFLQIVEKICNETQYEYLLKLHSKKSPHRKDGRHWLDSLLNELIPPDISNIIKTLNKSDTGAIGPASHVVSLSKYMGANRDRIRTIMEQITDKNEVRKMLSTPSKYPFFGGTMFWCRVDFIAPLLKAGVAPSDFNTEHGQVDGTTAHALERILGRLLHRATGKKMYIVAKGDVSELQEKRYNATYRHVE